MENFWRAFAQHCEYTQHYWTVKKKGPYLFEVNTLRNVHQKYVWFLVNCIIMNFHPIFNRGHF